MVRRNVALDGQARLALRPSKKSIRRMIETIHELTIRSGAWQETTVLVGKLNRALRGWANYFDVGSVTKAYRALDNYLAGRSPSVGSFLGRCHARVTRDYAAI